MSDITQEIFSKAIEEGFKPSHNTSMYEYLTTTPMSKEWKFSQIDTEYAAKSIKLYTYPFIDMRPLLLDRLGKSFDDPIDLSELELLIYSNWRKRNSIIWDWIKEYSMVNRGKLNV